MFRLRKYLSVPPPQSFNGKKLTTSSWVQPEGHNTGIQIYNCVAKRKVPLILRNKDVATWYTCGPTVYDSSHIGHASCYIKLDILQRILRNYFHINLITATNITDIDDKIIIKSRECNTEWRTISRRYENEFWKDMRRLGITIPNIKLRVTDNIAQIIKFIETLVEQNLAYKVNDGSVYFRVKSMPNYGKLQNINLDETSQEVKESSLDFALWKSRKEAEPGWSSPWGDGRPGWHIECSVLAGKLFGSGLDFHAGGLDLRFPHHENEEAQSCAFFSTNQWVNYWLHTGQLHLKGDEEKMSKSLKNTISIEELLNKYSSDDFRFACLSSNYRNSMEFGDELMQTAKSTLLKFAAFDSDCQAYLDGKKRPQNIDSSSILQAVARITEMVDAALRDDFDTAKSVGLLTDLTGIVSREINKHESNEQGYFGSLVDGVGAAKNFVNKLFNVFGFQFSQSSARITENFVEISELVDDLVRFRDDIRQTAVTNKSRELFRICDEIRLTLKDKGIEIKDHKNGSTWSSVIK